MAVAAALAETEKQFRVKSQDRETRDQAEAIDISVHLLALVML